MATQLERKFNYALPLVASQTVLVTGNSQATPVQIKDPVGGVQFVLDVTAGGTDGTDTLDVTIQTKADGANWLDVCRFTAVGGDVPTKRYIAKLSTSAAETMFANGTSLTAGNIRNIIGDAWCAKWVVVSGNSATFTFSITVIPC